MNTDFLRRSPVRARVLAGSLLLAVIGAVAAVPAASAVPLSHASPARPGQPASGLPPAGVVSWSVAPASATGVDTRTRFTYQNIKPGTTIFDHVAVLNRSDRAVAFSIYATDASGTTASGALTLLGTNQRPTGIGAWTTFPGHRSQLSVVIAGGKGIIEPFTITVPLRATPGDHVGGMIAAVGVPHRTASGTLVWLYQRIAVPMELRVTGKLVAALSVESVSIGFSNPFNPFGGGSARVTYSVVNTGNVLLTGTQTVTVTGAFGAKSTIRMKALPTVLPGDSIQYTASAGGLYPAGTLSAHVTVTPRWPSDATPLPVTLASASASSSLFAFPWALLVLIILLGGGGYGSLRLMRARRRAHQAEIAAAADKARRETERRLLGGTNQKASAGPGASTRSAATPGANSKTSAGPGTTAESPATPGTSTKASTTPGANGKTSTTPGTNRRTTTTPGPDKRTTTLGRRPASTTPGPDTKTSTTPGTNSTSSTTPGANGKTSAEAASGSPAKTVAAPAAAAEPAAGAAAPVAEPATPAAEAATPAPEAAATTTAGPPGGADQPE